MQPYLKTAFILSTATICLFSILFVVFGGLNQNVYSLYGTVTANLITSCVVAIFFSTAYNGNHRCVLSIVVSTVFYSIFLSVVNYLLKDNLPLIEILLISIFQSISTVIVANFLLKKIVGIGKVC